MFTFHFEYGFIPYIMGIPLVLWGLALFRLLVVRPLSMRLLIVSEVVTTFVYLSHVVNITALAIGAATLLLLNSRGGNGPGEGQSVSKANKFWRLAAAFLPALILFGLFLMRLPEMGVSAGQTLAAMEYRSLFHQLQGPIRVFFSIDPLFDILAVGGVLGLMLILLVAKKLRWGGGIPFWLGLTLIAVLLLMPRVKFLGGTDLSSRLAVFGLLSLLASLRLGTRGVRVALVVSMSLFVVVNVVFRTQYYSMTSRLTEQYVQAVNTHIPPGQKVLTTYCRFSSAKLKPMLHAISWYHIDKGGISPFLLFGNPAATGIATTIQLPVLSEIWVDQDELALGAVMSQYDYLVATTCGSVLPTALTALPDTVVHKDSVCTIWRLSGRMEGE